MCMKRKELSDPCELLLLIMGAEKLELTLCNMSWCLTGLLAQAQSHADTTILSLQPGQFNCFGVALCLC